MPEADACFFTRPVSFSGRPLRSSFAGNHTPIIAWLVGRDELFKRGEETYLPQRGSSNIANKLTVVMQHMEQAIAHLAVDPVASRAWYGRSWPSKVSGGLTASSRCSVRPDSRSPSQRA